MAKKKKSQNTIGNRDKRFISEVFDAAIQFARKNTSSPSATKIYDLVDPILKRRKAAVYNLLPEVRERFGHLYDEDGILNAWGHECSAMSHSIDGVDHLYHINLAIAMFMLDELKHSGKLLQASRYFNQDQKALMSVSLPDIYDPCHDEIVLRGMMELIRERDPRDNKYQAFINDISAKRTVPVIHQMPELDAGDLSPRERFNAVMTLIHPVVKERAMKRFEEKYWEFLRIFFECDAPFYKEWSDCKEKSDSLMDECRALNDKIVDAKKGRLKQALPKCVLTPQMAKPLPQLPNISSSFDLGRPGSLVVDDMERLQMMATKGLGLEDQAEEADKKRLAILFFANVTQMIKCEEAIESLGEDIARRFMNFEVNDPYETCFGYLCLLAATFPGHTMRPWPSCWRQHASCLGMPLRLSRRNIWKTSSTTRMMTTIWRICTSVLMPILQSVRQ